MGVNGSLLRRHSVEPERRRGSVLQQRSLDSLDHHTALIHRHHHATVSRAATPFFFAFFACLAGWVGHRDDDVREGKSDTGND
ncbi:hypothetical protein HPB48_001883 [Haemaphysalis longicornis]|uniref:Uncharacterized protein n=1 Tax=Haemaphysalis longicornis TaxID=44386 RepID=A0A9J6FV23_HAELO|nr:hypothetical protein HPB48_001883 [Haemaphysalis longicornis]